MTDDRDATEAAWRDLVARFDAPADGGPVGLPWPKLEDLADAPQDAGSAGPGPAADPSGAVPGTDDQGALATGPGSRPAMPLPRPSAGGQTWSAGSARIARVVRRVRLAGPEETEGESEPAIERYVPPLSARPPKPDSTTKAAWVAMVAGPGYLLAATLLGWTISGPIALGCVVAFVVGFVLLVLKLDERRDGGDDDGAVV